MTVPRAEYEDDKEQEVRGVRAAPTRLDRAKEFCASRESLQIHPLRNTHTNDVPVVMAEFARLEVESTQILDDDSLEMKARLRARSAKLESQLTESKAACDRADEVIVGLEARNTELEADNEAFDSLNDKLRQKVSDADEVIAGLEAELKDTLYVYEELRRKLIRISSLVQKSVPDHKTLYGELDALRAAREAAGE